MLHSESWQGGQENNRSITAVLLFAVLLSGMLLSGCQDRSANHNRHWSMEDVTSMASDKYALNSQAIMERLGHFCRHDNDSTLADRRVRDYYRHGGDVVWIDRLGTDHRVDTLLCELHRQVRPMGFSEQAFFIPQIERDLQRLRQLDFDNKDDVNLVAARLEYNLSKACLRYVMGQRFGFTSPQQLLNRLDARDVDTLGNPITYRQLFDIDIESPGPHYAQLVMRKVAKDSLDGYFNDIRLDDEQYEWMKAELRGRSDEKGQRTGPPAALSSQRYQQLMANMERCRWRERNRKDKGEKYLLVNVPAYHLWAVGPDTVFDMRAACGALKTKTPILSSSIYRMDVDPEWNIPMSIIRDDISRHAGDSSYFARHRYYIADRKTGKRMPIRSVSQGMLLSGQYRVSQLGGEGNSLGRIIFRFPNKFDVFLHDTSSRNVFSRDNRGVSHGCVRVQRPFDVARFLMGGVSEEEMPDSLVRSQPVSPRVPIYIIYNTLFWTPDGKHQTYPDVYGYDRAILASLKPFLP